MEINLKNIIPILFSFFLSSIGICQNTRVSELPAGIYSQVEFTTEQKKIIELQSAQFSGLPKVAYINSTFPYTYFSTTDFWPIGSWGRGYHSIQTEQAFYDPIPNSENKFYGCHPTARDASCFIRGHINLYLSGHTSGNSLDLAKKGIDYLLVQIYMKGPDRGSFDWWYNREGQTNINMDIPQNAPSEYETSHALVALTEFYLAKFKYRRQEVLKAIKFASEYLSNRDWKNTNNNIRGLGAWALSNAYKVTHDRSTLNKSMHISGLIMAEVDLTNTDLKGTWQTGGLDEAGEYGKVNHDTKIFYHMMILRGLIETFDIVPEEETAYKEHLTETIKIGINHVINYRLYSPDPNDHFLKYAYKTVENVAVPWKEYDQLEVEKYIETTAKLAYYASQSSYFNSSEKQNLKNLMNKIAGGLDPSNKWHICGIGYYEHYLKAINENMDVFGWHNK